MVWRSICNSWEFILKGTCWRLGDGASTRFWTDCWLKSGLILSDAISSPLPADRLTESVMDVSFHDGSWDMARFSHWLPNHALAEVLAHLAGVSVLGPDKPIWKFSHDGSFTTKSAYECVQDFPQALRGDVWSVIWGWNGPVRVKHFLWMVVKGGLKTNCLLWEKGLSPSNSCVFCQSEMETEKHLLMECMMASQFWDSIRGRPVHVMNTSLSVAGWISMSLKIHDTLIHGIPWSLFFGVACWAIWRARNAHIFREQAWDLQRTFHFCLASSKEHLNVHSPGASGFREQQHRMDSWVRWTPPQSGWIKWNLDGSVIHPSGDAASGAILRDGNGAWLSGITRHIWHTSITMAELWAFRDAITHSISRGDDYIWFESDSAAAVSFVKLGVSSHHPCFALVSSIRHDLQHFQHIYISHVYREGNFAADFLARIGHSFQLDSHVLPEPPPSLSTLLFGDSVGVSFVRRIGA
ncbi:Ribonuclease H-like superfamily [Sesbania bispinosa]|nr:Ribonuclease H-like superfamily [Sesbania bispinosa]